MEYGLRKRNGYRSLYTHDSVVQYIYAFNTPEAKRLLGVFDNANITGLGILGASNFYGYGLQVSEDSTFYRYIYTGANPFWTTWRGEVVMSNGRQRPLIMLKRGASRYNIKELVPPAPGEPLIVPVHDSGAYLSGTYRYATEMRGYCGSESFGSNELSNGDFETWTDTTTPGASWEGTLTDFGDIYSDNTDALNGTWCMRIEANGTPTYSGWSAVYDTITGLTDGAQYRMSAYFKSPNSGTGYKGLLMVKNTNGDFIATEYCDLTTSYAYNEVYFTKPESYNVVVYVGLYCPNKLGCTDLDTLYADSVVVEGLSSTYNFRESYITQPIKANDEKIMLTGFVFPSPTEPCPDLDDSVLINISRTKANPGALTTADKFYLVHSGVYTKAQIDTLKVIDSLTDDDIDSMAVHYIDTVSRGRDATTDTVEIRVGAPTYYSRNDTTVNIFNAPFAVVTPISMSYICTFYDTLSDIESDSSRSLFIGWHPAGTDSSDTNYTIGLPRIPSRLSNTVIRIYRAYTYAQSKKVDSISDAITDTTMIIRTNRNSPAQAADQWGAIDDYINDLIENERFVYSRPSFPSHPPPFSTRPYTYQIYYYDYGTGDTNRTDTFPTNYHLIDQVDSQSDSLYLDIVPFDSMMRGEIYARLIAPHNLNHISSFQDRLFGSVGSVLYWSFLDSAGYWGSFRNIILNDDDGDDITAIMPFKDYVKVYKNRKSFIVYPDGDNYARSIQTQAFGCIAPYSMQEYNDALVYLSERGVIYETGHAYQWEGVKSVSISYPINNLLLNRPAREKRDMVGFVYEDKYLLTLPGKDTTFVCFLNMNGYPWSIWTFDFQQATMYDTNTILSKTPSSDMVFVTGDSSLYLFDTLRSDAGDSIKAHYRMGLFPMPFGFWQIEYIKDWSHQNSVCLKYRIYGEAGDSIDYIVDTTVSPLSFGPHDFRGFKLDIQDSTTLSDSVRIDEIDLWYKPKGEDLIK